MRFITAFYILPSNNNDLSYISSNVTGTAQHASFRLGGLKKNA